jgi:predicted DNA-binding protein (MmcQ/YjbR family)
MMRALVLLRVVQALVASSLSMCASALVHAVAGLKLVQTASVAHSKSTSKTTAVASLNKLVWAEVIAIPELDRTMSLHAITLASQERRQMAAEIVPEEYLALLQWLSAAQDQTRQVKLHANACTISNANNMQTCN